MYFLFSFTDSDLSTSDDEENSAYQPLENESSSLGDEESSAFPLKSYRKEHLHDFTHDLL